MVISLRTGGSTLHVLVAKGIIMHDLCHDLTNEEAASELVPRLQPRFRRQIVPILADGEGRPFTYLPYFSTSGAPVTSNSLG